ncbi:MAG TPA: hypothetical protein VLH08_21200, partial [Acidobacteriota bacterium]|nr:hypothetical protein [Acidobacteriota bacterium]
ITPPTNQLPAISICENCLQQDSRLDSEILQLSSAELLFASKNQFPEQQLKCQKAIVKSSKSYVTSWIEAIKAGNTPEWADHFASRKLQAVSAACNVPILQSVSGITMPAVGGPCSVYTNQPYAMLDAENLKSCLHKTLEFWTSYLYVPDQQ